MMKEKNKKFYSVILVLSFIMISISVWASPPIKPIWIDNDVLIPPKTYTWESKFRFLSNIQSQEILFSHVKSGTSDLYESLNTLRYGFTKEWEGAMRISLRHFNQESYKKNPTRFGETRLTLKYSFWNENINPIGLSFFGYGEIPGNNEVSSGEAAFGAGALIGRKLAGGRLNVSFNLQRTIDPPHDPSSFPPTSGLSNNFLIGAGFTRPLTARSAASIEFTLGSDTAFNFNPINALNLGYRYQATKSLQFLASFSWDMSFGQKPPANGAAATTTTTGSGLGKASPNQAYTVGFNYRFGRPQRHLPPVPKRVAFIPESPPPPPSSKILPPPKPVVLNETNMLSKGELEISKGNMEAAEKTYRDFLSRHPENLLALNALGSLMLKQGKWNEAGKNFKLALAKDPKNSVLYFNLGISYYRLGRWTEAKKAFQRSLKEDPTNEAASQNLLQIQNLSP